MVYNTDMRLRAYDSNGLKPTLICTIGFNVSKHIKNIDIYGGTTKLLGKYRIVWNHKWLIENNININSNINYKKDFNTIYNVLKSYFNQKGGDN